MRRRYECYDVAAPLRRHRSTDFLQDQSDSVRLQGHGLTLVTLAMTSRKFDDPVHAYYDARRFDDVTQRRACAVSGLSKEETQTCQGPRIDELKSFSNLIYRQIWNADKLRQATISR